jgi:hypothetical protein
MDKKSNNADDRKNPITIKSYKYNGYWSPQATSTCPLVPKHHRTYGKPSLYESMAEEIDRRSEPLAPQNEM